MNSKPKTFYSNGKLLLTGEYVVLEGALALALPTKRGQSLKVEAHHENKIVWKSLDEKGEVWFEENFEIVEAVYPFVYEFSSFINENSRLSDRAQTLLKILFTANQINNTFLSHYIDAPQGIKITTALDFPINWGLGTSSTLINNIANWAQVDPYTLLNKTFGGSGYDIACAQSDSAISFQLLQGKPVVKHVDFNPSFKEHIYFMYLNKKQNSREGIAHYKSKIVDISIEILAINDITLKMIECNNINEFQDLMDTHERIISGILKLKTIKDLMFKDFEGSIKSLGAWGGDFVMVACRENPSDYFKSKGFETIIPYQDLIK